MEIARLTAECARLRDVETERDSLQSRNQALCGANEKLLLATLVAQSLREDANAANQRQNEFLAMLAHELRNPLAPISMAGSMLARLPEPSAQLSSVQNIIERQVTQLSRLLDDLLDAARINSGKISMVRSPILLADQIRTGVETVESRMRERRQRLELQVPPEDIVLYGDAVRLAQVFSNLLVNASKFTDDGGTIVLSAKRDGASVIVTVADNGAGMAAQVIPHIFSLFTQGPRCLARTEGGLGVGLNVVKNVVEMHGGSVVASSPGPGQGSVFTVSLPLPVAAVTRAASAAARQPIRHSHRILLVEDNRDASEMLGMVLRSDGHTVVTAFDGPGGLATALAQHFDVLVCDIGLPGIDGYALIRTLRDTIGVRMPFAIAVSGYGMAEDRARALAAGFEEFMIKPVEVDFLLDRIAAVPARLQATQD